MSHSPVCRACGYAITGLDPPMGRVDVCPRCNRPLAESSSTNRGTVFVGIVGVLLVATCLGVVACPTHLNGIEDEAALKAQNIQKACVAFHMSRGRFPESLNELVTPAEGKLPMLEGGQAAITDPWQQPYQFELIDGPNETKRPVVWTTTPKGKRIQWPRE